MGWENFFQSEPEALKQEGNCRVFANLERHAGDFPRATRRTAEREHEVTV
jgi:5-aminolevulinate synthase